MTEANNDSELKEFIENKHVEFEVVNITDNGAMVTLDHGSAKLTKTLAKDMMAHGYALWESGGQTSTFARLSITTEFGDDIVEINPSKDDRTDARFEVET